MINPVEALDALLEELKRQKAAGVRRVSVSDDSLASLKSLSGAPAPVTAQASLTRATAPAPSAQSSQVRPVTAPAVVKVTVAPVIPIADPPVFTLAAGTKEQRLEALALLIGACAETKKHLVDKQRPLLGQGAVGAKIVFVGEAPSLEEIEAGRPFAGPAGEILQKILTAAALAPSDIYLMPAMVWRPEPPTPYGKRIPTARELAFNLPYLRAQIDIVQPKVVVALGAIAFQALHGPGPLITQARGQWYDLAGLPLMATYHPNYLLHNSSTTVKRAFWEDFLLVLEKAGLSITEKQRGFFTAK